MNELKMNKYGGIADVNINPRIYKLWFQMLRRCYDTKQQERNRGKSYVDCEVCEEWKKLSRFASDIQKLEGYEKWLDSTDYCLDKDTKNAGNKVYNFENCRFILKSENIRDISKRNPDVYKKALECRKTKYILKSDDELLFFDNEKEACEFLGVKQCVVASCYRSKCKCKGYTVLRETDMRTSAE